LRGVECAWEDGKENQGGLGGKKREITREASAEVCPPKGCAKKAFTERGRRLRKRETLCEKEGR